MYDPETELTQQSLAAKETKGDTVSQPRPSDNDCRKSEWQHLDRRSSGHERDEDEKMQQVQRSVATAGPDLIFGRGSRDETRRLKTKLDESVGLSAIKIKRDIPIPNLPLKRPYKDHSSTSPFLSARKHCKTEASQAAKVNDMSKVANGIKLATPFTYLTVAVGVVCGIDIQNNENEDDMVQKNLLESQDLPQIVCKPVYTEDGFIVARSKPKLLVGWYLHAFQLCMGPT